MSRRSAVFGALGGLAVVLGAQFLVVSDRAEAIAAVVLAAALLITAFVGTLIVVRRDGHPIGWILIGIPLIAATGTFVQEYAAAAAGDASLPAGRLAGWMSLWASFPAVALGVLLFLLFPSGTLPSRRWMWVARAAVGAVAVATVSMALMPGPLPAVPRMTNPLGVTGLGSILEALSSIAQMVVFLCALAGVGSQVLRLRRAPREQVQQIKWVAYTIVLLPVLIFVSQLVLPQGATDDQWLEFAINVVALTAIPAAIGMAILRYRLYDIDAVINRTLVYGGLTALLAGSYFGSVVLLQRAIPGTGDSDLAVAASTLAVAALFRPARSGVQGFIDRRFYRRKYDAQRTLQDFTGRLRDEVELTSLSSDVLDVVRSTVQPNHVSLWLRPEVSR